MTLSHEKNRTVELRPKIYQIRSERPGGHVYLIKGSTKNVLIDAGMAAHFRKLENGLEEVGLTVRDINLIILTHEHFDHIGAAALFPDTTLIAAHGLAANKIQLQHEFVMYKKYFDVPVKAFRADIWIQGDTLFDMGNYRLRAIHTPGHSSGCICLYEPDHRLLFTGDTIFSNGILSGILASGSISDYVNSIERLKDLRVDALYPGHGNISKTPYEDLERAFKDAKALLEDSKILFETLDTKASFKRIFCAVRNFNED
jgi:hydroxyacylglutathione hydrolase